MDAIYSTGGKICYYKSERFLLVFNFTIVFTWKKSTFKIWIFLRVFIFMNLLYSRR